MRNKVVSGIVLTLLLMGMLTLAFNVQPARADYRVFPTGIYPDDVMNIQWTIDNIPPLVEQYFLNLESLILAVTGL